MHKGYTISYFISSIKKLSAKKVGNTVGSVTNVLSPRLGVTSDKTEALDNFLNGQLYDVVSGDGKFSFYGKTARTRLLTALKNRKKFGNP